MPTGPKLVPPFVIIACSTSVLILRNRRSLTWEIPELQKSSITPTLIVALVTELRSVLPNIYHVVNSNADCLQIGGADIIDTDNDPPQHIDIKCMAVSTCVANSGDHRKVVSHIFGRNKACTRKLPKNLWILWCRKHYQRFKYRAEDAENWHTIQLGLVRNQLQTFEDWGGVRCWTISLRKAEQDALAKEKQNLVAHTNHVSVCWERFLLPYLGVNKTFAHVRQVLEVIDGKFNEAEYRKRDKKLKMFPGVEFLPVVQKAKEDQKPAAKKGEITYKKITLDQPTFNRKNRANTEYIKEMAAKKREASNTPKSSGSPCEKENYPEIDNDAGASTTIKRETSITDNATDDPAGTKSKPVDITLDEHKALPTKRRRLTRGYEKHGSDGEETTAIEKEGREGEE